MMLTLQSIPERLAVAEAEYKSARASHDKWLARFNDERTELARLRTKREEISEEIATAKSEAATHSQTWLERIKEAAKAAVSEHVDSKGHRKVLPDVSESRLAMKMAENRAVEYDAVVEEIGNLVAAQCEVVTSVAQSYRAAHRTALVWYARREALRVSLAVIPQLRRAQAIVASARVAGGDVEFMDYLELPRDGEGFDEVQLTDGMFNSVTVDNRVEYAAS